MALDWFEWNGQKCTDFGIHVSEQPPVTIASERATFTNVPGRPGSLTTLEGDDVYEDLLLTATCFVENLDSLSEISAWLRGAGTVTFANRQEGHYLARVVNQIPFEKILRGRPNCTFAVNFRCKPFLYLEDSPTYTIARSGSFITNPGRIYSEPIITVYGSGDITLIVGMTITELTGVSGSITLDSVLQEAYSGYSSLNHQMSGDFPRLLAGQNAVNWIGNVDRLTVQANWRTL